MVVVGLAVLGMTATLAAHRRRSEGKAAAVQVRVVLDVPRAHWADVDKDNATGNQKILHLRSPTAPSSLRRR